MASLSFVGRVLFVSVVLHSVWQEMTSMQIKFLATGAMALKALGSILFINGSDIGATLLILHQFIATPFLYEFYNYDTGNKLFLQRLTLLGGLLLFVGMKKSFSEKRDARLLEVSGDLLREKVELEMMIEENNDYALTQLDKKQSEIYRCYEEISRLMKELSRAKSCRPATKKSNANVDNS